MKSLLKNTILLSFSDLILLIISGIRGKYLALTIGPNGIGTFAILSSFVQFLSSFNSAWLQTGFTKLLAEFKTDEKNKIKIYSLSITISLVLSILTIILFFIFLDDISLYFLNDEVDLTLSQIFIFSIFNFSTKQLLISGLQGLFRFKQIVIYKLWSAVFEFVLLLLMINYWGITGFFLSLAITSVLSTFLILRNVHGFLGGKLLFPSRGDIIFDKIKKFAFVNFLLTIISYSFLVIQRKLLLDYKGLEDVGLYSVATSIVNYISLFARSASMQFFPSVSEVISTKEKNSNLIKFIDFTLLSQLPIAIILILFSDFFIKIMYADSFLLISALLYLFAFNAVLSSLADSLQTFVVAQEKLNAHVVISIMFFIVSLILLYTVQEITLSSIIVVSIIGSTLRVVLYWRTVVKNSVIRFPVRSYLTFVFVISILLFSKLVSEASYLFKAISFLMVLVSIFFIIDKNDRKLGVNMLTKIFKKNA